MSADPGALYRDHATAVWRYARARVPSDADAEDVTSDVFTRAIRSASRYEPSRGTARAWLVGITANAVADWWRRRPPESPHDAPREPDLRSVDARGDDPAEAAERAGTVDEVHRMLTTLSDREREALALRFGAELSSAEIGTTLGISPTAARMLVHRAVTKLRKEVGRG